MALGTIVLGEDAVIEVSADDVTFDPISDLNSYSYEVANQINNFPVFQRATAHGVPGTDTITLTLSGLYSVGDAGQDAIRAAKAAGTNVTIKLLPDGTNGISISCRVGSVKHSGTPENPGEVSFEFAAAADPVDVGNGL